MSVHFLATVFLGPLLFLQGIYVRRITPALAEPSGERCGVAGNGPPLKLLILGDSAAAGVGANHQQKALSGQLVALLQDHYSVSWRLLAVTGATTAATLQSIQALAETDFDVIVISLGVNDVTKGVALKTWLRQQSELRALLHTRFHAHTIVSSGVPPMGKFPALPQPLRWYLGRRATEFDQALAYALSQYRHNHFLSLRFSDDIALMASDGFHPGPHLYQQWAERLARIIRKECVART